MSVPWKARTLQPKFGCPGSTHWTQWVCYAILSCSQPIEQIWHSPAWLGTGANCSCRNAWRGTMQHLFEELPSCLNLDSIPAAVCEFAQGIAWDVWQWLTNTSQFSDDLAVDEHRSKQVSLTQTYQNIWMGSVIQRQTLIPAKMPNIFPGWWFDDAFPILLHHFQVPRYFLSMPGGCFFSAYLLYYPNTSQVLNCQGVTLSIVPWFPILSPYIDWWYTYASEKWWSSSVGIIVPQKTEK
jgi:hypothetical protein